MQYTLFQSQRQHVVFLDLLRGESKDRTHSTKLIEKKQVLFGEIKKCEIIAQY